MTVVAPAGSGSRQSGEGPPAPPCAAAVDDADVTFVQGMVPHHRGALEVAQTEIAEGSAPDAVPLAEEIADSQAAETEEMETPLAELGG